MRALAPNLAPARVRLKYRKAAVVSCLADNRRFFPTCLHQLAKLITCTPAPGWS